MKHIGKIQWEYSDGSKLETLAYARLNLLAHAEIFGINIMQACGGQAECGTCRVGIIEGETSEMIVDERELRKAHKKHFSDNDRLACRARPRSDMKVRLYAKRHRDLRED